MAKFINGINGPIKGKVGTVIGSSRNGVPYLKGPYKRRTKKVSKEEFTNREKSANIQYWLKPLLVFLQVGFKGYNLPKSEGFVSPRSYLSKTALEGDHINPSMVQVSYGDLPLPDSIAVGLADNNHLQFTWDTKVVSGANRSDQVMLLAYDIEGKDPYFTITGQFRRVGSDTLQIPSQTGKIYHLYFAFVAADRSRQSHSLYLGTIEH
jgi:hypothetical protein